MKKTIKTLLLIIAAGLLISKTTFGQTNIQVFNTPVVIDKPLERGEFPTGYPVSIGCTHLWNYTARALSRADLNEIYNAVLSKLVIPVLPVGDPVMGAFFTTEDNGNNQSIRNDRTHGLCFAFHADDAVTLYYFEANPNGKYTWVPNLTTKIASISDNLFIALHYCRFSPGSFPGESTVYRFVCDTMGHTGDTDNADLYVELSKDPKRRSGLFSLGMADSLVLSGCETPNASTDICEGACQTYVPNSNCALITNMEGFWVYTCQTSFGHCAAGSIERRRRDEGIDLGVPVKFKLMRDFRDGFMTRYCESRKYIGFYYAFSKFAKMDLSMLWKYASVLPELYTAMQNMVDETTDNVVITSALREKTLEILREHEDVEDSYFHSILIEVERDLDIYTGLKRSEIISLLSPGDDCTAIHRTAQGQSAGERNFAAVYMNENLNEIEVNYSLNGSRIHFELFNSAAVLVSSLYNDHSFDQLSIPTSGLSPGIYYYRITSDLGYKKMGKIAILK